MCEFSTLTNSRKSKVSQKIDFSKILVNEDLEYLNITINVTIIAENNITYIKSLRMTIHNDDIAEKVIKGAIQQYNNIFEKENLKIKFNKTIQLYNLKPSKKNGKPKDDLPGNNY